MTILSCKGLEKIIPKITFQKQRPGPLFSLDNPYPHYSNLTPFERCGGSGPPVAKHDHWCEIKYCATACMFSTPSAFGGQQAQGFLKRQMEDSHILSNSQAVSLVIHGELMVS